MQTEKGLSAFLACRKTGRRVTTKRLNHCSFSSLGEGKRSERNFILYGVPAQNSHSNFLVMLIYSSLLLHAHYMTTNNITVPL